MATTSSTEQEQQIPLTNSTTDKSLDNSLTNLSTFLRYIGFTHHFITRAFTFLLLAVATPLLLIRYSHCNGCDKIEIQTFQLEVVLSRALVAAVSLFFVSKNVDKYGLRKVLFLDGCHGHVAELRKLYLDRIRVFYCLLGSWFGVCFLLKVARELTRIIYLQHDPWWMSVIFFVASLSSWSYTTLIFLGGCALFNLVGNLQVIKFENFGKILEKDLDVSVYIEEHMSLTRDLSKISHRFRMFLLIEFLIVTASQFVTLLQVLENQGIINLINGGDFGVLSIVQLVGIVMCLTAAAKISHRAQSLGSVASKWHAYLTCNLDNASVSGDNAGNPEATHTLGSLTANYSESDLESSDYFTFPATEHMNPSTSSYHKRQAFVTYIKSNTGGFTIFGWLIDRMLINTVFFIELSLVFFILGKTITITTR